MRKVPKMTCSKKPDSQDSNRQSSPSNQENRSHIKNGQAYFKNVGRYNEITKDGAARLRNGAPEVPTLNGDGAQNQNLVNRDPNSAAAVTVKKAFKELGW